MNYEIAKEGDHVVCRAEAAPHELLQAQRIQRDDGSDAIEIRSGTHFFLELDLGQSEHLNYTLSKVLSPKITVTPQSF